MFTNISPFFDNPAGFPMQPRLIGILNKYVNLNTTLYFDQRDRGDWQGCESNCSMLGRLWWSFQARGLLGVDQDFPDVDCSTVSRTELSSLALAARRRRSVGGLDKAAQRRASVAAAMYRRVPLLDRLKVRDLLMPDFKLHGYDPTPRDVFPELYD